MNALLETTFKLTQNEILSAAASTILLNRLKELGTPERSVAELCNKPQYGYTTSAASEPIGPRLVRITDIQAGAINWSTVPYCECEKKKDYQLVQNDILVARTGASVGKSFLVKNISDLAIFASYLIRLQALKDATNSEYLYWCFQSQQFWEQILKASRGSAIKNVNGKMLSALSFSVPDVVTQNAIANFLNGFWNFLEYGDRTSIPQLPPEFAKQQRIVAKIEQLAAKVEEAQKLRGQTTETAQTLVASEIRRIFTNQDTGTWQQGCLGDYVIYDCYGTSEKCYDEPIGTPILRMGNIQEGRLDISDLKYLEIVEKDRQKLILKKGDIVVNRTNSAELVGKCAVFDLESEHGFASYLIRLRLDATKADPYLVAMYINSPIGREYMFRERKQMTGQANVNAKKLKALPIKLPDLSEQKRIVAYLDNLQAKVDNLKQFQAQTQTELDALLPSILDKAFKGEL